MHNLLRCRRGSAAFATVVALVPLIGVVALGAEAGSWYVTKQHAQEAADAAAYSGALRVACSTPASCDTSQDYVYRGKQFAALNAFCNAGDSSYSGSTCASSLPANTTRAVQIDQPTSSSVRAVVSQQQPGYLSRVLGLFPGGIDIRAQAIAQVETLANPCVLALTDSIHFQGSTTVNSPNCGLASNSSSNNSIDFTGNGVDVSNAGSISAMGGCAQTGGTQCSKAITYAAKPVPNPLSGLDAAISALKTTDFPDSACPAPPSSSSISLPAYGAPKKCYYDMASFSFKSNTTYTLNGVYFFADGQISIGANTTITGTATLILLPPKFVKASDKGASLKITGGPTIQITAPTSVSAAQVPTALAPAPVLNLLSSLLIYDPEVSNKTVDISGNSASFFTGITYVPNSDVTYQGSTQSSGCAMVIAKGVTLSGNSNFDNTGCPASVKPISQYVRMVQ